jgi:hypothetical protein
VKGTVTIDAIHETNTIRLLLKFVNRVVSTERTVPRIKALTMNSLELVDTRADEHSSPGQTGKGHMEI